MRQRLLPELRRALLGCARPWAAPASQFAPQRGFLGYGAWCEAGEPGRGGTALREGLEIRPQPPCRVRAGAVVRCSAGAAPALWGTRAAQNAGPWGNREGSERRAACVCPALRRRYRQGGRLFPCWGVPLRAGWAYWSLVVVAVFLPSFSFKKGVLMLLNSPCSPEA